MTHEAISISFVPKITCFKLPPNYRNSWNMSDDTHVGGNTSLSKQTNVDLLSAAEEIFDTMFLDGRITCWFVSLFSKSLHLDPSTIMDLVPKLVS